MAVPKDLEPKRTTFPDSSGEYLRVISPSPEPDSYLDSLRRSIQPTRLGIAQGLFALLLSTATPIGLVYAISHNDPAKQNMRSEIRQQVIPATPGPTSEDDCAAFSSGDPWFDECMKNRELRKQTVSP